MKKHLLVASCLAFVFACSDNTNRTEQGSATNQESGYSTNGDMDSTSGAAVSAATRQSEVDTNRMNIGTDRSAGGQASAAAPSAESIARGEKLIASSDCLTCHKVDQKIVGPAYQQVAEKYAYNDQNVNYLAGKIIKGGAGVWGQIAMNAHPDLSQEDAQEMARYILSLKK